MKNIGKLNVTFEDLKKLAQLPNDALIKQYIVDPNNDTLTVEFYTNHGDGKKTDIRRYTIHNEGQ